jgi:hypothetical protein
MGLTKSEIFTAKQNKLVSMMKALAHPACIAIDPGNHRNIAI